MADRRRISSDISPSPSTSSSGDRKRRDKEPMEKDNKKRKSHDNGDDASQPEGGNASQQSLVAGESTTTTNPADNYVQLSSLLSGLIDKLENSAYMDSGASDDFSGFPGFSSSEEREEGEILTNSQDPLDDLDNFNVTQPAPSIAGDDVDFNKALEELSGHFLGEEEKGDPLSDKLATILNASLRRRPVSESVKLACSKIKVPANVPNLIVPATNAAITKALSVGGKLIDARLSYTNSILMKALVPVAQCISDIGDRKGKPVVEYLDGLNNSLRLLASAVNYLNHLRKEVARIHVNDTALTELCKSELEVGQTELFPFDVVKKCDEIHKTKKLGRPSFRPFRGYPRFSPHQQGSRRPAYHYPYPSRPGRGYSGNQRSQNRSFLGQRPSRGRGTAKQTPPQY